MKIIIDVDKFCDDCEHLALTEEEQDTIYRKTGERKRHMCRKYNVRLYHLMAHPNILRCEVCLDEDGFEKKEK